MDTPLSESTQADVLTVEGLSKSFSGVRVVSNVAFAIAAGEVHGLIGQNGSGKSTIIKILSGYHAPDPGAAVYLNGKMLHLPIDPDMARRLGMAFVHQDLGLANDMSVLENIRVGWYETSPGWRIDWKQERAAVATMLRRFGLSFDPSLPVGRLSAVHRAMVAIVRAVEQLRHAGHGVLILDEPTASLPRDGVEILMRAVRDIATSMGVGVLFVSHRLDEVLATTDRVSVLRDGRLVKTAPTRTLSERHLIEAMLGQSLDKLYPTRDSAIGDVVLSVRGLTGKGVASTDLDARRGEILGITGLLGMGQETFPYLLFGAAPASGALRINGRAFDIEEITPRLAMSLGIGFLPADRKHDSSVGRASVAENVSLTTINAFFRHWRLNHHAEIRSVSELLGRFEVRPREPSRMFQTLSGGNQQKALLAKWFQTRPSVLLLHEPTQGVDVGSRSQIFSHIREAASQGCCVVIASTEYEDLAHLCDRVLVFRDGLVRATITGGDVLTATIVAACYSAFDPGKPIS